MYQSGATDDPALREHLNDVVPLGGGGLRAHDDVDRTSGVKGNSVARSALHLPLLV